MKKTIFLYKLLLALKKQDTELDAETLYNRYYIFSSILDSYNLDNYIFKDNSEFITDLLFTFLDFEMGIYTHDHKLIFYNEPSIEESVYKFTLKDVSDKLINEIALLISFDLREHTSRKQLVK